MTSRLRLALALLSAMFVAAHLLALPRTLEDQDSINFALAVEEFDVPRHRPHPPGYPVYVAMAKASTATVRAMLPSIDRDRAAAVGLAAWGLIAGAVAPFVIAAFWLAAGFPPGLSVLASALAVTSPLFWFTASRPMTDVPGLVAAVAVQALWLQGLRASRASVHAGLPREWIWGAAASGFIIGLRSQTIWLTAPLLCWCAGELVAQRRLRAASVLAAAAAAGALLWAIPMLWFTGGLDAYIAAVGSQGHDDLRDVQLLSTSPTLRMLQTSLTRTFVWPWAGEPQQPPVPLANWLGTLVVLLAVTGTVRLALKGRRVLAGVLLSYWLYVVFHLTFQETATLRYALPTVVPVAGLAVAGLAGLGARLITASAAAVAAVSLVIAQPALRAYAGDGDPFFRGFQRMAAIASRQPVAPTLRLHHQVWWPASRVIDWFRPQWDAGAQPHPGAREWLALVTGWAGGSPRPAWYLTDVSRTDVALFDPRSRTFNGRFELRPMVRALMPGARLDRYAWWEIQPPGWMLGAGWALTPEIAGMTAADGAWPHQRPAQAFIRRGAGPARVLIGGRYLTSPDRSPATLDVEFDRRRIDAWPVTSDPNWFVHWIDLPSTAGPGAYGPLLVRVVPAPGQAAPTVGLEQFDAAPVDQPIAAFVEGWQEPEGDRTTGRLWRWTSDRSTIEIRGGSGDLVLALAGESPLRYFDRAPDVAVRAGAVELARFRPDADFAQQITIPAGTLAAAAGRVTLETSLTFVPAERGQNQDRRTLGLRMTDVRVRNR